MSGVQKYLLVECDVSMLFINNQPGCCLISIYVLVPAAWISLMSSIAWLDGTDLGPNQGTSPKMEASANPF